MAGRLPARLLSPLPRPLAHRRVPSQQVKGTALLNESVGILRAFDWLNATIRATCVPI